MYISIQEIRSGFESVPGIVGGSKLKGFLYQVWPHFAQISLNKCRNPDQIWRPDLCGNSGSTTQSRSCQPFRMLLLIILLLQMLQLQVSTHTHTCTHTQFLSEENKWFSGYSWGPPFPTNKEVENIRSAIAYSVIEWGDNWVQKWSRRGESDW